ncbi:hypothetical protein [Methanobrevibacter sp.]|uniref:hypothetical protein n=1 Tax=Methanobrevibacter sp. TaxID=66852 RepID=UPI00388FD136
MKIKKYLKFILDLREKLYQKLSKHPAAYSWCFLICAIIWLFLGSFLVFDFITGMIYLIIEINLLGIAKIAWTIESILDFMPEGYDKF